MDASPPKGQPFRTVEITDSQLIRLQTAGLVLAHALRSLDTAAAEREVDRLLTVLSELLKGDLQSLKDQLRDAQEHQALRSAPHSALSYPKLWEKTWRSWGQALAAFEEGGITDAVAPLGLMSHCLEALQHARGAWAAEYHLGEPLVGRVEGTSPEHREGAWIIDGLKSLGTGPLAYRRLQVLTNRAEPLVDHSITAIGQAAYDQAELRLRSALRLDPAHGEARLMLGEVLRRTDRIEEARAECHHLREVEAVRKRQHVGPAGRLRNQVRIARVHLCLARCDLVEARLEGAHAHLHRSVDDLEWSLRHATPDVLTEADRAHLVDEAHQSWSLLDRLSVAIGQDRPARLRP